MIEQFEILKDVIGKLEILHIEYMLTGSIALAIYSEPRMTRDIDIVVSLSGEYIEGLIKEFSNEYYIDDTAIQLAIQHKKMFNILHYKTGVKVDFIIRKDNDFEITKFDRMKKVDIGGFLCNIINKEDLIIQKLYWSKDSISEQQIRDVRSLIKTGYDGNYVNQWITRLNLLRIWEVVQK